MAVIYLDKDDEITGAVARLRALEGGSVILVLPEGSRIGTSRINFKLLAREARERGIELSTVSDEPAVRALAAAAGVPAFATVDAAGDVAGAAPIEAPPPTADAPGEEKPEITTARPPRVARRLSVEPPLYEVGDIATVGTTRTRRRRAPRFLAPAVAGMLALVLVGLGLYAAYLFVPTADVSLQPRLIDVGPLSVTVIADPQVAVVDESAGLIPATSVTVPVEATGTFTATGTVVTTTAASGRVRFSSQNTFVEVPVPAGTVVSTAAGVEFETTDSVTVPRADFSTQTPGTVMADVVARERGVKGNVSANAIRRVPQSLDSALVSVRNPQATSGGSRLEASVVTQEDYDAALAALTLRLQPLLAAALADPATTPRGLTLFAATAVLGPAEPDQLAADLVDKPAETFTLALGATATALAVNEALVDDVGESQLQRLVPAGTTLLPSTVNVAHPPGEVVGGTVRFRVSGAAQSWRPPDAQALVAEISGQTVSDARTIMDKYGLAEISIWPDFIDRLPDGNRIRLTIIPPQESS